MMDYWKSATDRQERATNSGHETCHRRIAQLEAENAKLEARELGYVQSLRTLEAENERLRGALTLIQQYMSTLPIITDIDETAMMEEE